MLHFSPLSSRVGVWGIRAEEEHQVENGKIESEAQCSLNSGSWSTVLVLALLLTCCVTWVRLTPLSGPECLHL